jgi:hypothetical protein
VLNISCAQKPNDKSTELKQNLISTSECLEFTILVSDSNYFLILTKENKIKENIEEDELGCEATNINRQQTLIIIDKLEEYELLNTDNIHDGKTELKSNQKVDNQDVKLSILVTNNDNCKLNEFFIVSSDENISKSFLKDIGQKLNYEKCFEKLISEM